MTIVTKENLDIVLQTIKEINVCDLVWKMFETIYKWIKKNECKIIKNGHKSTNMTENFIHDFHIQWLFNRQRSL